MIDQFRSTRLLTALTLAAAWSAAAAGRLAAEDEKPAGKAEKITYEEHVKPIFREKCFTCHNSEKKTAGLDLSSYTTLREGGGSGEAVEPGDAEASYLYSLVSHESEPYMPPNSERLPDEMLAVIKKWIDGGALENAGSKPVMSKKPKIDLTVTGDPTDKPEGPPPLPERLSLAPVVTSERSTAVTALATSPWAPLVAVGGQQQVLLYHAETLKLLGVLPFPEGVPYVLKFSRNGQLLLAGGGRGASHGLAVVWNVLTGERVFEVGDEMDVVLGADISSDQTMIALGGPNRVVRVYSTADGSLRHELRKHTDWVYSVAFSPDGVLLATSDRNGGLFVWESHSGRQYLELRGHSQAVTRLAWRADSNLLASCSEDATIRLWEMENGGQVKSWGAHGGGTASVEFARDGRLVSCGRDRTVKLWDQNGKETRAFEPFADLALEVTHCDQTDRVIAGDWNGDIRVWNAADGQQLGTFSMNPAKLDDRLAAANQLFQQRQQEHGPLAAQAAALHEAALKIKADLAAAQKSVADNQAAGQAAAETIKQATESIKTLTAERDAAAQAVAALEAAIPLLEEAALKGRQAAEKVAGDKPLVDVAAQLDNQLKEKKAALEASRNTHAEKSKALEAAQTQLAQAQKQAEDAKTALDAAQKRVAEIEPTLQPAETKAAEAKAAADEAARLLAAAQQERDQWAEEIEFRDRLAALDVRRKEHAQLAAAEQEAAAAAEAANAQHQEANRAAEDLGKQSEAAQAAVEQVKQKVTQLTAEQAAAAKSAAELEPLIPLLEQSLAKGQEAATKAPADEDVTQAAAQLKGLLEKKSAALAVVRQTHKEKTDAIATANQDLKAAETRAAELAAAHEAANKQAADKAAVAQQLAESLAAAQQASRSAKAALDTAQAAVDELKAKKPASTAVAQAGG